MARCGITYQSQGSPGFTEMPLVRKALFENHLRERQGETQHAKPKKCIELHNTETFIEKESKNRFTLGVKDLKC